MANDRIYIGCNVCKKAIATVKHMGQEWYRSQPGTLEDELLAFLNEHRWCLPSSDILGECYDYLMWTENETWPPGKWHVGDRIIEVTTETA